MIRRVYLLVLYILRAYFESLTLFALEYNRFLIIEGFRYSSEVLNRVSSVLLYFLYPYGYVSVSRNAIKRSKRKRGKTRRSRSQLRQKSNGQSLSAFGLMFYSSVSGGIKSSAARSGPATPRMHSTRKRDNIKYWIYQRLYQLQILIFIPLFYMSFLRRFISRRVLRPWLPRSARGTPYNSDIEDETSSDETEEDEGTISVTDNYNTDMMNTPSDSLSMIMEMNGKNGEEQLEVGLLEGIQLMMLKFTTGIIEWFREIVVAGFDVLSNFTPVAVFSFVIQRFLGLFLVVKRRNTMKTLAEVLEEEEAKSSSDEGVFSVIYNVFVNLRYVFKKLIFTWAHADDATISEDGGDKKPESLSSSCWSLVEYLNYPHELYTTTTEDGYVLDLVRIPSKSSKNVVFFQHGVLDSVFAWISSRNSLPFHLHDIGCDIFLGNLRGTFSHKTTDPSMTSEEFWDFSINEHGLYDITAFISKIHEVKDAESCNDFYLTAVGHSLGAEAVLMNIVWARMHGIPHHISQAILFAPAGYHEENNYIWDIVGPFIEIFVAPFSNTIKFPSEVVRYLVQRLFQDVRNAPATRQVFQGLMSSFLGSRGETLESQPKLLYSVLGGTSMKIYYHFMQQVQGRQFTAFDYGSTEENERVYGTAEPLNFFDHYDGIDIPIHFLAGTDDSLIKPVNVLEHYQRLSEVHPELAFFKLIPHCGHTDFTLKPPPAATDYVLTILKSINKAEKRA